MASYPTQTFHDGRNIPQLGFGTWQIEQSAAAEAVRTAIAVGYRMVDTAAIYHNESGVGEGLRGADEVFLTTKIWNDDQGYDETLEAGRRGIGKLGRGHVDLLLIHWPAPKKDRFVETWRALIELRELGLAKSIGVSNFRAQDIERLQAETGVLPVLNQIELHPAFQQRALRRLHDDLGIVTQSWSPLGQGGGMDRPEIRAIAEEAGRPAAAVILRWHLQHGLNTIPKASSRAHMEANFEALAFTLSDEQMARIDALDDPAGRLGPDPADLD
jgi:2,5-diketo-D-gluconate reductase A